MGAAEKTDDTMVVQLTLGQLKAVMKEVVNDAMGKGDREEYLTIEQVSKLLNKNIKTIRVWVKDKGLPASRAGNVLMIRRDLLTAWLEAQAVKPGAHVSNAVTSLKKAKS
jgi:excisionase family DNA binding protein